MIVLTIIHYTLYSLSS